MLLFVIGFLMVLFCPQFFTDTYIGGIAENSYTQINNILGFYGCILLGLIFMLVDYLNVIRLKDDDKPLTKE